MRVAPPPLGLLALVLMLLGCGGETEERGAEFPRLAGAWLVHRDAAGFSESRFRDRLDHLQDQGYRWLALAAEPAMADVRQPNIDLDPHDDDLRRAIRAARAAGFRVLLFPRIESESFFRPEEPLWRGDIAMDSALAWSLFHDQLESMLLHYAAMAAEEGVDLLSLGLEYRQSTRAFPERWRRIIAAIRAVYPGPLTYSANWYEEFREIEFWDALDHIGVGAYFPVAGAPRASPAVMRAAWQPIRHELAALSRRFDRPVLFSEIGYPGVDQAGWKPWEWTTKVGKVVDHDHQADCYRAFLAAFADADFVSGLFVWRYEADPDGVGDMDYSPERRPAEAVIRRHLRR